MDKKQRCHCQRKGTLGVLVVVRVGVSVTLRVADCVRVALSEALAVAPADGGGWQV